MGPPSIAFHTNFTRNIRAYKHRSRQASKEEEKLIRFFIGASFPIFSSSSSRLLSQSKSVEHERYFVHFLRKFVHHQTREIAGIFRMFEATFRIDVRECY